MRAKPRVVHMVPAIFGDEGIVGGAERFAYELAKAMARETPTRLLSFGDRPRAFQDDELSVRILGKPWRVRGQSFNSVHYGILPEIFSADVVHCHQQHILASSLAALTSTFLRKKCFVSDLGGGGWDVSGYVSTDGWYRGHLHISEYSRKVFGHEKRTNAHVILGGVDVEKFRPDQTVDKENLVVFAGRLMPHKGIDYLVQGLPEGLRLEVIGRPYNAEFTERLKKLAEGKQVVFRHDCDDTELVNAYRRALCVVLPSVYETSDGFTSKIPELLGQTLIEAMACGTAAVCTDVASMPEIVVDRQTGFIVPPNDSGALSERLALLRDDHEEALRMGYEGRRRVEALFTWGSVVGRCLNAYSTL